MRTKKQQMMKKNDIFLLLVGGMCNIVVVVEDGHNKTLEDEVYAVCRVPYPSLKTYIVTLCGPFSNRGASKMSAVHDCA
jgi:hypothetical protein